MMKNECSIIRDILPLYLENMVSEDTAYFVEKHLEKCPECREELKQLRAPAAVQPKPNINAAPLRQLKKVLLIKKVQTILCTSAVLLALILSAISYLTAPEYFQYTPELVTVTEGNNGKVILSFDSKVTNCKLQKIADPDNRNTVYNLELWTSAWDRMFNKPGAQELTAVPENDNALLIYFTEFTDDSSCNSVCIYGGVNMNHDGWVTLPGLSLGYWLLINIFLFVILGVLLVVLRKKEHSRRIVERFLLIPVAYGLGHLCVLGLHTVSYSEWRDFQMIIAIGTLFYCAMLLALNIVYFGKELWKLRRKDDR